MDITNKALIEEIVKRVEEKLIELGHLESNSNAAIKDNLSSNNSSKNNEEITYNRRLLSEKDVVEHNKAGIKKIVYSKNTIVTDVAKDYAKQYKIELIEQN